MSRPITLFSARMMIQPIARLRSCFPSKFGVPRQPGLCPSAYGTLVFEADFRSREAIRGIEGFSHLWLIFGFHRTADQGWKPTVRPPRLGGNSRIGVFASRSTFRPNALGLSLVVLEAVDFSSAESPVLHLGGIDLIDGTPVYDIKPYLSYAESISHAHSGYAGKEISRLPVKIDEAADESFSALPERDQQLIREALSLDPRPAAGRNSAERIHGCDLCGVNVKFLVDDQGVRITAIEPS